MAEAWVTTTIGDVLQLQRGFDITKQTMEPGDVPVIASGGISGYHSKSMDSGPGVVIGRKGSLGTVYYSAGRYWPSDTTLWVKDFKGSLPRFVYYFFKTFDAKSFDVGSANPTLNRNHVHQVPVSWPSLPEQQRIAAVLSALDAKIDHNRRLAMVLDRLLHQLYRRLLAGRDETWTDTSIGVVTRVVGGSTPSTKDLSYWDGEVSFITPKDLSSLDVPVLRKSERKITEAGLAQISSGLLPSDKTVLLSSRAPIGYIARPVTDVAVNQGFIAMICDGDVGPNYILQWARENVETFKSRANGTTFLEINKKTFRPIPISVPPTKAAAAFEAQASPYFDLMANLLGEIDELETLLRYLLPRLMSRRLVVSESYDARSVLDDVAGGQAAA